MRDTTDVHEICDELEDTVERLHVYIEQKDTIIRKRDKDVALLRNECNRLRDIEHAIFAGGFDLSPCMSCWSTVVCIPDGMPMCMKCAESE